MGILADSLLILGTLGLGVFCLVLARRLRALGRLENGMGGAIAVLSAQVDELTRTLATARTTAEDHSGKLEQQTRRAEAAVRRLELLLASLNDLPDSAAGRPARSIRRRTRTGPTVWEPAE